jgi:hypothetical protein
MGVWELLRMGVVDIYYTITPILYHSVTLILHYFALSNAFL